MQGIILINKPKGVTSSSVVSKVKFLTHEKCGHLGTLDPLAEGVLPICIGRATRLFDYFLKKQKTYIAHFTFGYQTSTLDLEGEKVKICSYVPTKSEIEMAIEKHFLGDILQTPPEYSAKKLDGQKAYDLARKNKELDLKPVPITIYKFDLMQQINENTFEFEITCSAGTYIRALARDIGFATNSCATMTSLVRTKVGAFDIKDCIEFENLSKEGILEKIIPQDDILRAIFPCKINISKEVLQDLLNGKKKFLKGKEGEPHAVFCEGKGVGIGFISNNYLTIKTYLL